MCKKFKYKKIFAACAAAASIKAGGPRKVDNATELVRRAFDMRRKGTKKYAEEFYSLRKAAYNNFRGDREGEDQ